MLPVHVDQRANSAHSLPIQRANSAQNLLIERVNLARETTIKSKAPHVNVETPRRTYQKSGESGDTQSEDSKENETYLTPKNIDGLDCSSLIGRVRKELDQIKTDMHEMTEVSRMYIQYQQKNNTDGNDLVAMQNRYKVWTDKIHRKETSAQRLLAMVANNTPLMATLDQTILSQEELNKIIDLAQTEGDHIAGLHKQLLSDRDQLQRELDTIKKVATEALTKLHYIKYHPCLKLSQRIDHLAKGEKRNVLIDWFDKVKRHALDWQHGLIKENQMALIDDCTFPIEESLAPSAPAPAHVPSSAAQDDQNAP